MSKTAGTKDLSCRVCSKEGSLGGARIGLAPSQEEFEKLEKTLPEKAKRKRENLKTKLLKDSGLSNSSVAGDTGNERQIRK